MGRYLWSERYTKSHEESQMRARAYAERQRREAAEATQAAWSEWNAQEARGRVMGVDVTRYAPAEDADWRAIGKATAHLIVLIEAVLDDPYVDQRAQDADSADWGYRAGGADTGDYGQEAGDD